MRAVVVSACVSIACLLDSSATEAFAQTQLPQVVVTPQPKPRPAARRQKTSERTRAPQRIVTPRRPAPTPSTVAAPSPEAVTAASFKRLDEARTNIAPPLGANTHTLGRPALESLPQGTDTTIDKVLLQAPGVSQDSAASGQFHVRNEHANVQYRINGILLPDGVSGFGQVLDTRLIGSISLVTGALPAQYGLHTSGIVDIQTRSGAFE